MIIKHSPKPVQNLHSTEKVVKIREVDESSFNEMFTAPMEQSPDFKTSQPSSIVTIPKLDSMMESSQCSIQESERKISEAKTSAMRDYSQVLNNELLKELSPTRKKEGSPKRQPKKKQTRVKARRLSNENLKSPRKQAQEYAEMLARVNQELEKTLD